MGERPWWLSTDHIYALLIVRIWVTCKTPGLFKKLVDYLETRRKVIGTLFIHRIRWETKGASHYGGLSRDFYAPTFKRVLLDIASEDPEIMGLLIAHRSVLSFGDEELHWRLMEMRPKFQDSVSQIVGM